MKKVGLCLLGGLFISSLSYADISTSQAKSYVAAKLEAIKELLKQDEARCKAQEASLEQD